MIDTLSGTFLCIISHSILLFITLFDEEDILTASLPASVNIITEESRVAFNVHLIVALTFNILEMMYLLRRMPSPSLAILSMISHAISCLFILKFIIDAHPASDFWWLFGICVVPNFIANTISLLMSLKIRSHMN